MKQTNPAWTWIVPLAVLGAAFILPNPVVRAAADALIGAVFAGYPFLTVEPWRSGVHGAAEAAPASSA
jgi:hypothetical protein